MSNSSNLNQKVPLQFFGGMQKLSLKGTHISSTNFLRLTTEAKQLRALDISNCRNISEEAIFNVKYNLQRLQSVNISHNSQFSVLMIAIPLLYKCIVDICCWGKKLDGKELLFIAKTFSRLTNGGIDLGLDGIGKDYFCDFWDSTDSDKDPEDR